MATVEKDLGLVVGPTGPAGKDANISSATGTVTPGHKDSPTVTVDVGGSAGENTLTFTFDGIQGADGKDGAAAAIGTVTATVDENVGKPEVSVSTSDGDGQAKNIIFDFKNLKGQPGETGPAGEDGKPGEAGPKGDAGTDAKISTVNVTVNPGHSDEPSATAEVSGDAGDQTVSFTFDGLQGQDGVIGKDGAAAGFGTITVTVEDDGEGEPTCDAQWDGENTAKNLTLTFHHLKGPKGEDFKPEGAATDVVLGDGTVISLDDLVEQIRTKLGAPTTSKGGLVTLPADPNA